MVCSPVNTSSVVVAPRARKLRDNETISLSKNADINCYSLFLISFKRSNIARFEFFLNMGALFFLFNESFNKYLWSVCLTLVKE